MGNLKKEKEKREIGARLKELRIKKGLTMEEVAKGVGAYGSSVISNWEKGKTTPKPQFMKAYADFFGVPEDWIRYGDYDFFILSCLAQYAEILSGEEMPLVELKNGLIVRDSPKKNKYNKTYDALLLYADKIREEAKKKDIGYDLNEMVTTIIDVISSTNPEALAIIEFIEQRFYTVIIECREKGETIPKEIENFADEFIKLIDELKTII